MNILIKGLMSNAQGGRTDLDIWMEEFRTQLAALIEASTLWLRQNADAIPV
jgi:hypothetical protein